MRAKYCDSDESALRTLATIVSLSAWRKANLVMLIALDASGSESDHRLFVVAGFVSSAKDWDAFDLVWRARLKRDGLTHFHMHRFAHSLEEFKGWDQDENRRRTLLADLLGILQSHTYRKFGAIIINRFLTTKLSHENVKTFNLCAYSLAGLDIAYSALSWAKREAISNLPQLVFEDGDLHKGKLMDSFKQHGFPAPSFEPKKDGIDRHGLAVQAFTPLQAADILAYEILNAYTKIDAGKPLPKLRWPYKQLETIPGELKIRTPNGLEELEHGL